MEKKKQQNKQKKQQKKKNLAEPRNKKYSIEIEDGLFVGLKNFGRTYQPVKTMSVLSITFREAEKLAKDFHATKIIENTYNSKGKKTLTAEYIHKF